MASNHTGLPYSSETKGVMHACGHDAHTAILLGVAEVLVLLRDELAGDVKLIFQPAEEGVPSGEEGGASLMIREGVLEHPDVSAIFALHANPEIPAGKVGYRPGGIMASVDRFKVEVIGRQSHAAMPWEGIDPVLISSYIVSSLQSIVSRRVDARDSAVVTVASFNGSSAWNIIPERVVLEGTVRAHDPEVRRKIREQFEQIVRSIAAAHGATVNIQYNDLAPVVWNDPALTSRMVPTLQAAAGAPNVFECKPLMAGEDFALYARLKPGLFIFLGVRNEAIEAKYALHTPKFRLDEASIPVGIKILSLLAIDYLNSQPEK